MSRSILNRAHLNFRQNFSNCKQGCLNGPTSPVPQVERRKDLQILSNEGLRNVLGNANLLQVQYVAGPLVVVSTARSVWYRSW
jgi:hypothetical protein